MKRLLSLLLLVGFLSATFAVAAHYHKATDEISSRISCTYCNLAASPAVEGVSVYVIAPAAEVVWYAPTGLEASIVRVLPILDFAPNHSPPHLSA